MVYRTDQGHASATAIAGPFTLREVVVMAGGVLLLLGSVLPFQVAGTYLNIWGFSSLVFNQFVSLALPLLVAGAFAWRRMTKRKHVRVGSLTLDQLGSVVAVLTVLYFFLGAVISMNAAFLLGLVGALAFLAGTTSASVIPGFAADFEPGDGPLLTRPVREAAPSARAAGKAAAPSAVASPVPNGWPGAQAASETEDAAPSAASSAPFAATTSSTLPERESATAFERAAAESSETEPFSHEEAHSTDDGTGVSGQTGQHETVAAPATVAQARAETVASRTDAVPVSSPDDDEPFEASRGAEDAPAHQAFWFAVPRPREVFDERTGRTVFTAEPGAWILALEDRGHEYLVQDTDGRIGVLRDLTNVERA